MNIYTIYFTESNTTVVAQQPHGHRQLILLMWGLMYWLIMTVDIENTVKQCTTSLGYQLTQTKERALP